MADVNSVVNTTEIGKEALTAMYPLLSPLIKIFEVIGIVLLVYIIFLIIRAFSNWRTNSRIKSIARNVEQINEKLDVLIKKPVAKEKIKKKTKV